MDPSQISPQWLAGFFDGEGWVYAGWGGTNWLVQICVSQKDVNVLAAIQEVYGGTICKNRKGRCFAHVLRWNGRAAKRVVTDMIPYSIVKKRRLELALMMIERIDGTSKPYEEQRELSDKIRELNRPN